MFARRLTLALAALAGAAVLEGLAGVWALSVANDHVLRGRVASDIELAFKDLTVTKLRLRDWFAQAQAGLAPEQAVRQKFQADMQASLARLRLLSAQAIALDSDEVTRDEHLKRIDAVAVLANSVTSLAQAASPTALSPSAADARQAWQQAGELFDVSRGRDLRQLLAESVQREASAVARERAAADRALSWMRGLWLGAAGTIALAALALGVGFTRALRRPLDELKLGAQALQLGELTHRIPLSGRDEFSVVASSMNAMAVELHEHRARETQARQQLEALVDARTAELQAALADLQQVDTRRRRLFADISHELRTPTTAILGEAEITLRGGERPAGEYRDALQRIVGTAGQLGSVIDDLLTMARSDVDSLTLNRRPMNLLEPLREAVAQAGALAAEHRVLVQLAEPSPAVWPLQADPQRLRQLAMVLLDNAVRYSQPGGQVQVSVHRGVGIASDADGASDVADVDTCEVRIVDQGIGIAPDDLPRVFDRHFRSEQARLHRADGIGLGLSIAQALARAHGGSISLSSESGRGTTVRLRLPLLTDAA